MSVPLLATILSLSLPADCSGQAGAADAPAQSVARFLHDLPRYSVVRIASLARVDTGEFIGAGTSHLVLLPPPAPGFLPQPRRMIPLDAIDTVWVIRRSSFQAARTGAVVLGLAVGTTAFFVQDNTCGPDECGVERAANVILGFVGGAAIGAAAGHVVDRMTRRGKPMLWTRPSP